MVVAEQEPKTSSKRPLTDDPAGPGFKKSRKMIKEAEAEVRDGFQQCACSDSRSQPLSNISCEHRQAGASEQSSKKRRRRKKAEKDVTETRKQLKKPPDLPGGT